MIFFRLLIGCLFALPFSSIEAASSSDNITLASDSSRIHLAAEQLVRSQLVSGFYPYDFNFVNGEVTPMSNIQGVNLVRQTGVAFALAEYLKYFNNASVKTSLDHFLTKSSNRSLPISKGYIQSILERSGFYYHWLIVKKLRKPLYVFGLLFDDTGYGRVVSVEEDYERAWPGATALTLSAATKYFSITGDTRFNEMIQRWKDGLIALKVPERGFREAPHYLTESDYVNGEAWLALAEYSAVFSEDKDTQKFLIELEDYLFELYGDGSRRQFFHWGMMAAIVRANEISDSRLDDFIHQLTKSYIDSKEGEELPTDNSCAAVEGLASYVSYMNSHNRGQEALVLRARAYIARLMEINRRLQIGPHFIKILPTGEAFALQLNNYQGAFIKSLQEPLMQVDYTQHCLNALLRIKSAGLSQ